VDCRLQAPACPHAGAGASQTIMQTYHGSPGETSWICMPPDTDITRTARQSAQRLRSAPQARFGGLAHIFPQFWRWMRRRRSPAAPSALSVTCTRHYQQDSLEQARYCHVTRKTAMEARWRFVTASSARAHAGAGTSCMLQPTCIQHQKAHAPAHVHLTPEGARSALPAAQLGDRTITTRRACERTLCARRRRRHAARVLPPKCRLFGDARMLEATGGDCRSPSQSRGAASIHLGHHRGPSTSSLRDRARRADSFGLSGTN